MNKPHLKLATIVILSVILAAASVPATYIVASWLHARHVQSVVNRMAAYDQSDWKTLYDQSIALRGSVKPDNVAIDKDLWPPKVCELEPAYVWVFTDSIEMTWTGGFSPQGLRLDILPKGSSQIWPPRHQAGVIVFDSTRKIPEQAYLAK